MWGHFRKRRGGLFGSEIYHVAAPKCTLKRIKTSYPHRGLEADAHSIALIISLHNGPQSEAIQMFIIGWTDKMGNGHSIGCYSTIKHSEIMINVAMWMNLKTHNAKWKKRLYNVWFHLCEMCRKDRFIETESRPVVSWARGAGRRDPSQMRPGEVFEVTERSKTRLWWQLLNSVIY